MYRFNLRMAIVQLMQVDLRFKERKCTCRGATFFGLNPSIAEGDWPSSEESLPVTNVHRAKHLSVSARTCTNMAPVRLDGTY